MEGALHRKLIEESSDIATIIDSDGTITYVSPSVTRTLGYEPEGLIGEVGYEYQHPEDRDTVADAIESLQTNPADTQIIETRFRHADVSWCWIEATLQNRFDDPDISGILVNSHALPMLSPLLTECYGSNHKRYRVDVIYQRGSRAPTPK